MSEVPFVMLALFLGFAGFLIYLSFRSYAIFAIIAGILMLVLFVGIDTIPTSEAVVNQTDNTIIPITVNHMDQDTGTGFTSLRSGGNIFIGQEIANTASVLNLDNIDSVCMSLSKTGSPTGNGHIGVWDSTITPTATNYLFLIKSKDVSTISTTQNTLCFTSNQTNTWTLRPNQALGMFFNGGSAGNEVNVYTNTTGDVFDGSNSLRTQYVASWTDTANRDLRMIISLAGIEELTTSTYDDTPNTFLFGQESIKVFFAFLSAIFIFIGVIQYVDRM